MKAAPDTFDPDRVALFLDIDGTLLDLQDNPDDVIADRELLELLGDCRDRLRGALSLVSGRSIQAIDRIFAPAIFPVAGAHGTELRFDGGRATSVIQSALPPKILAAFHAFAARRDGLLAEPKHGGVSLHFRRAPQLEAECRRFVQAQLEELGEDFRLIAGKMVLELAPSTHHKGSAITTFLEHTPFEGRVPIFVGDDVTDEDGFRVANAAGGTSIRVGGAAGSEANYQLPDVAAVRPWLRAAILGSGNNDRNGAQAS